MDRNMAVASSWVKAPDRALATEVLVPVVYEAADVVVVLLPGQQERLDGAFGR